MYIISRRTIAQKGATKMYRFIIANVEISADKMLKPIKAADEIAQQFISQMSPFPLGNLLVLGDISSLDGPVLFYDFKKSHFFVCTVNILLDLHAAHLNAEARERQRKALNAAKYKAQRIAQHGAEADQRHNRRVSDLARQLRNEIYARV
jgi:hypothetical protein